MGSHWYYSAISVKPDPRVDTVNTFIDRELSLAAENLEAREGYQVRKEYLDWGDQLRCSNGGPSLFDDAPMSPKHPTGPVQATVLHRLIAGPWNGWKISCFSDSNDCPWQTFMDGHECWTSAEVAHPNLVEQAIGEAVETAEEVAEWIFRDRNRNR